VVYILKIVKIEQKKSFPETLNEQTFIDFLFQHLGQYGDKKEDIKRAIEYSFSDEVGKGGFLLIALKDGELVGGVVINDTGMKGYIPDHILVYIATHKDFRGKGIGTSLLEKTLEECQGDISLHVEYENPAVHLYKRTGFTSKYAEMRYKN
jgi:GNAT superfamily N-acetyltransferase